MIATSSVTAPEPSVIGGRIYFSGLNGIRAIAALAVLVSHINMSFAQFNLPNLPTLDLAGFGVTIFFSLSGFLITYLLLAEKGITQTIDIPKFYVRRILRIWPLYFLYLLAAVATANFAGVASPENGLLYYLFFIPNIPLIAGNTFPFLAHYWSLGVEEQFYSFWPWVVKNSKQFFYFLVAFIFLFLILKVITNLIWGGYSIVYTFLYVTRFDCMAIGAIGAWLLYYQKKELLRMMVNPVAESAGWITLGFVLMNRFHTFSIIDHELIALVTVVLILNQCSGKGPLLNLETRALDFIGRLSFGIYVYHPLIIFLLASLFRNSLPDNYLLKLAFIFGLTFLATITFAYLSYRYFEKPALAFKEKYTIINSSSSREGK